MTFAIIGSERAPGILDRRPADEPSAISANPATADFLRIFARHRAVLGMRRDFHHVAGRLHLRAEALRQAPATLEAICREFEAVLGVRSAAPNRYTGSIVINYDPLVLSPGALAIALQEWHPAAKEGNGADLPWWAEHLAGKAIEWLIEKLAVALIAAVV